MGWVNPAGLMTPATLISEQARQRYHARREAEAGEIYPTIKLYGRIDDKMERTVLDLVNRSTGAQEFSLLINSDGGLLNPARAIYRTLRSSGRRITARAWGRRCSAATTLLLAGDYRECTSDTIFLLHEVEIALNPGERWTSHRHQQAASSIVGFNKELSKFYSSRTGYWASKFETEMRTEKEMSAERARDDFGLVQFII